MAVEEPTAVGRARRAATRVVRPRTERDRVRRRIVALCLPFVVLATVSGFVPLWEMAKISVSESQFFTEGFTLEAYRTLVTDPYYWNVAVNTLLFAIATTAASLAVAVPAAHALEKYDLPGERLMVTVISFPISLPGIVAAFMIIVLFGNTGLLTNFFAWLSGQTAIDLAIATSVAGLFLAYLYSMIPRSMLLLRGTYAEVNTDAEEAARSLGATPLQTFYYVTLPQIKPGLIGALILTFRTALAIFGTVLILKSLTVWTLQINREIATGFNIRIASAMAALWFVFVFGFTFLALRFTSAEVSI
jgi:putative spermidine/putrescine transport system permease protein